MRCLNSILCGIFPSFSITAPEQRPSTQPDRSGKGERAGVKGEDILFPPSHRDSALSLRGESGLFSYQRPGTSEGDSCAKWASRPRGPAQASEGAGGRAWGPLGERRRGGVGRGGAAKERVGAAHLGAGGDSGARTARLPPRPAPCALRLGSAP